MALDLEAIVNGWHGAAVAGRRQRVLAQRLTEVIPAGATVLDVGSGNGGLAHAVMAARPDVSIVGVDVVLQPVRQIPVSLYDGTTLPFADDSFDCVTIIDVLHHTNDPAVVLREAARVARQQVIIKDHLREGFLAGPTLRLMDWVGNRFHGVALPYNYLQRAAWQELFRRVDLEVVSWREKVGLYPVPFSLLFDRSLHFVSALRRRPDATIPPAVAR